MPHHAPHPDPKPTDSLYECGYCGDIFVVPTMARACEKNHEKQE